MNSCNNHVLAQTTLPLPSGLSLHEIYARLSLQQSDSAVLDSAADPSPAGRFSLARYCFIAQEPFGVLEACPEGVRWISQGKNDFVAGNPLQLLQRFLDRYRLPAGHYPTPFPAGAIGFLNYGLKALIEPCPNRLPALNDLPLFWFGFYDAVATIDLHRREVILTSSGLPEQGAARQQRARERLDSLITRWQLDLQASQHRTFPVSHFGEVKALWSRRQYLRALQRVKQYIADGDVYQVNLAQCFQAPYEGDPTNLFLKVRRISPVPFGAFIHNDRFSIISASPERFLQVCPFTRKVLTRPIKGTRPRGENTQADERLARELLHSAKDHAEHIMIVDLERNDLGRVAEIGSVRVAEMMVLEGYAQVYHLTSTVEAVLRPDVDIGTLLRATFPGGSITGAPKVRAMQIIEEIEPFAREVYTGSIGYIGFHGGIDLNIAIRTAVLRNGLLTFYAGGGIVADSQPLQEYEETLVKALGWFRTIAQDEETAGEVAVVERATVS